MIPETASRLREMKAKDSDREIRERFVEQMGIIAQGDGAPRIAGRMMGLMVFDGRPYSFSELATELQVSRGSISTNARILEQQGVLERTALPGDRQDYFQLAEHPCEAVLTGALVRSRRARSTIARTAKALPVTGENALKRRLERFDAFYATIIGALEAAMPTHD